MNNLYIESSNKTLRINCEPGRIEFSGCSILDDPVPFFKPVYQWIKAYLKNPPIETLVNCRLDYVDSASFKHIFLLFRELEKINHDRKVTIKWYVENNDPEIIELGEILEAKVRFKFEYIIT